MNYLAHALLAGPLATDRVGGVAGDFVKGLLQPRPAWLDPALAEGVRLHRRIDSFADTHPAFRRSRARVSDTRKRFGGVLVDMFYDHFLAVHWHHYSPAPLTDFTAETYRLLASHLDALPGRGVDGGVQQGQRITPAAERHADGGAQGGVAVGAQRSLVSL